MFGERGPRTDGGPVQWEGGGENGRFRPRARRGDDARRDPRDGRLPSPMDVGGGEGGAYWKRGKEKRRWRGHDVIQVRGAAGGRTR